MCVPTLRLLVICLLLGLISGCGGESPAATEIAMETALPVSSPTPLVSSQITSVPAATAVSDSASLTIWWPDEFYPTDVDILDAQIRDFALNQGDDFDIELRRKPTLGDGGIMSTLASANAAAPGALPDLTLMQRRDLISAAQAGLINPMDEVIRIGLDDNIYDTVSLQGVFEGGVYGLPYAVDVTVLAMDAGLSLDPQSITFEAMLMIDGQWAFPAGRLSGVSRTVYLQYLSISDNPFDVGEGGTVSLDPTALQTLFEFYEMSREAGTITTEAAEYASLNDYTLSLITGDLAAGVITFSEYLPLSADNDDLRIGSVPVATGDATGYLDGWMWVMISDSPQTQAAIADFLEWVMLPERQQDLTAATNTLPSRRDVLLDIDTNRFDTELLDQIISNGVSPLTDITITTAMRSVQSAVASIIIGDADADAALESLQDLLAG